ncbi:hypothetical protein SAMN04489761_4302 [Tenacibaculum sp. MAR_2009_124]|uniref:hypothetical protein n=1 Tax=Tenacibaculum sp. MAR_2009_124 TaxID=1250059 RepID=UPI000894DB3B|nr:hypothetical protein [Tenacibaculum sp. MAR_2009_124]SED10924.1 hypothetical protein SAMN04489761_4302 [Tenacibaculum sp. MAR_2009_124]
MSVRKELDKEAQKLLKGTHINPVYANDNDHYSKKRFAYIYQGFDFLENLYVIRTYIQKRYSLDRHILEILLKLMGMKIFTRAQYSEISKSFTYSRWDSILNSGYLNILMDHYNVEERIYTLNPKGRNIVIKFYKYLSGEEKIPEDSVHNPMANKKTQKPFDKKKMDAIKKLNQLDVSEHKKSLFT